MAIAQAHYGAIDPESVVPVPSSGPSLLETLRLADQL